MKGEAYLNLGKFISTFEKSENLNDKLLENYCKMTDSDIRDLAKDNEVILFYTNFRY